MNSPYAPPIARVISDTEPRSVTTGDRYARFMSVPPATLGGSVRPGTRDRKGSFDLHPGSQPCLMQQVEASDVRIAASPHPTERISVDPLGVDARSIPLFDERLRPRPDEHRCQDRLVVAADDLRWQQVADNCLHHVGAILRATPWPCRRERSEQH